MSFATPSLHHVVSQAGLSLARAAPLLAVVPRRDPFSIELPPVVGGDLSQTALVSLGALYLFSQLDQAGVIVAVEALVEARADLSLRDDRCAEALEAFALEARSLPGRTERESIYARLFGEGAQSSLAASGNHDFSAQLAAVCTAVLHLADSYRVSGRGPSAGLFAPLQFAAQNLVQGLALHAGADVTYRTRRIHTLLVRALSVLALDGVTSYFGAHNAADVVRTILGGQGVDLASAQRRGLSGQQLIVACGQAVARGGSPSALVANADDAIVHHAAEWLAASGAASTGTQ
jgi:hypothetical protein